jgi:hypothetical protein
MLGKWHPFILECRPLLEHESGARGYRYIAEKFDTPDGFGPTCVRRFVGNMRSVIARRISGNGTRSGTGRRLAARA